MSENGVAINVPKHLGYAGNTRGLRKVLTEIVAAIGDIDGLTTGQVNALIASAIDDFMTESEIQSLLQEIGVPKVGEITLVGASTPVLFEGAGEASLLSDERQNWDPVDNADSFNAAVDGGSPHAVTVEGTAATFVGGTNDIGFEPYNAQPDKRLKIAIDQDFWNGVWHEIEIGNHGAHANDDGIAAQLQTAIRAIATGEADYSEVSVAHATEFTITGNKGSQCVVGIDRAATLDATDELDLAPRDEGKRYDLDRDTPDGGAYKLGNEVVGFAELEHDDDHTAVQTALRALFGNDGIAVAVAGADFRITFPVALGEVELELDPHTLSDATPTLEVERYYWERYVSSASDHLGTGNLDYLHLPTAESLAALLDTIPGASAEAIIGDGDTDKVKVTTDATGGGASLKLTDDNNTPIGAWGFTEDTTIYGGSGLDWGDLDSDDYFVFLQPRDTSPSHAYSVDNRATTGFTITANGNAAGVEMMVNVILKPEEE